MKTITRLLIELSSKLFLCLKEETGLKTKFIDTVAKIHAKIKCVALRDILSENSYFISSRLITKSIMGDPDGKI